MNLKKYLQQQVEKDAENLLTERDRQFCAQLAENVQETPVKQSKTPKIKLWASISSAVAVVLLAVIILPFAFLNRPAEDIFYKEENIVNKACSLEETNIGLNSFIVEQSESSDLKIRLFYDSVSNNNLYYEVSVKGLISEFRLIIVVNEKYNYEFDLKEDIEVEQLNDYDIHYANELVNAFEDTSIKYSGFIKSNSEIVYIDYEQVIDLGEQAFFDDIQSVLKAKN